MPPLSERRPSPINRLMKSHANRGVFRRYDARELRGRRIEHSFLWITDQPMTMIHDSARSVLTFRDLLPGIPRGSSLDCRLREFVRECSSPRLPAHRRLDPRRIRARCMNRKGTVSIVVNFAPSSAEYAAGKAIDLVGEIFFTLLSRAHNDYMVRQFGAREE